MTKAFVCYIIISFGAISAATRSPRARFVLLSSFFLVRIVCASVGLRRSGLRRHQLKNFIYGYHQSAVKLVGNA